MLTANIHSIETSGFFDGPGIRTVVFFQGCPLRCIYCHNPDTWSPNKGERYSVRELLDKVKKYKNYYRISKGGVTLSGGEPLMQAPFVLEFIRACKEEGIHVALDLSGTIPDTAKGLLDSIIKETDLVLLDIKGTTAESYKKMTRSDFYDLPEMIRILNKHKKNVWVRYVAIPGINDSPEIISEVRTILSGIDYLKKVEVLPFHQLGKFKYETLSMVYPLENHTEMSQNQAKQIEKQLEI